MNDDKPWHLSLVYEGAINAEARRVTTLQVLGIIAISMGALVALTTNPGTSLAMFAERTPGWPWLSGTLLIVFGTILTFGSFTPHPRVAWFGAITCFAWYAWFGVGFAIQWIDWVNGAHIMALEPPIYPTASYLGLAALHFLNARGIREQSKDK